MEKKKTETVNIILRKDDVETRLSISLLFTLVCAAALFLFACGEKKVDKGEPENCLTKSDSTFLRMFPYANNKRIPFFGSVLEMDDSTHVMQQIEEVIAENEMLSIEHRDGFSVLKIGDVVFRINICLKYSPYVPLLSSTPVDDPKMVPVIECLNGIYGPFEEVEPCHYWWRVKGDDEYPGGLVRLRFFRGSETGGADLLFSN